MEIVDYYKALVIKELPKNGIIIYVSIGYDSWNKPQFHYTSRPLLHTPETCMEDIIEPFLKEADSELVERFYKLHKLVDVKLITTNPIE